MEVLTAEKPPWMRSQIEQGYQPLVLPFGLNPDATRPKKQKGPKDLVDKVAALEPLARVGKRLDVRLVSLTEAARRLGIKRGDNIEHLIRSKQLKVTHIKNRKRPKVAPSEIERLMREGFSLPGR